MHSENVVIFSINDLGPERTPIKKKDIAGKVHEKDYDPESYYSKEVFIF